MEILKEDNKFFQDSEGTIPAKKDGDPVGLINGADPSLHWVHEGSALVALMLQDGFNYIVCEVLEKDKKYFEEGGIPRFIITKDEDGFFIDAKGNMWDGAQAILPNGDVMTYKDYLEIKHYINNSK